MKYLAIGLFSTTLMVAALPGAAQQGPEIGYQRDVTLTVGQSAVIYGYRGDCGRLPDRSAVRVPATNTGRFSFGRDGWRMSRQCGGPTPAVELVYTATAAGRETIRVQGDEIRIRVSN